MKLQTVIIAASGTFMTVLLAMDFCQSVRVLHSKPQRNLIRFSFQMDQLSSSEHKMALIHKKIYQDCLAPEVLLK